MRRLSADQLNMHPFLALDPERAARRFEETDYVQETARAGGAVLRAVIWLGLLFGGLAVASHLPHARGLVAASGTVTEASGH